MTTSRRALLGPALAATLVLTACGGGTSTEEATLGARSDVTAAEVSEPARAQTGGSQAAAAEGSEPLTVVAAFYPLEFLTARVGGERVAVPGLTPPGAEPHDLEITPQVIVGLQECDLVVSLGGFQPAVDEALTGAEAPVVDLVVADRPHGEAEGAHADEEAHADQEGDVHADEEGDEHGDTDPTSGWTRSTWPRPPRRSPMPSPRSTLTVATTTPPTPRPSSLS